MELLHHETERVSQLTAYLDLLVQGKVSKEAYLDYSEVLESATPFEVNEVLDAYIAPAHDVDALRVPVSRFIRSVGKGLDNYPYTEYPKGHLLFSLNQENEVILAAAKALQELSKQATQKKENYRLIREKVAGMRELEVHYTRLQNELFPLFEGSNSHHGCVKLMWSLQDSVLDLKKQLTTCNDGNDFWKVFAQFYFTLEILVYREQRILFPVAYYSIPEKQYHPSDAQAVKGMFTSLTGSLSFGELEAILKVLPLDIAFIDDQDRVKFYSDPPHRIFPRTPMVIGRLVQNCHPPKSVATVEKILSSFKEGISDTAEFYLTMKDAFIHIEYFSVRDEQGTYLGTLEVTQDATKLRALVGEKRLL
ncbi:MAG: PAS domain-containing protein [Sphaerochaeta sp.]